MLKLKSHFYFLCNSMKLIHYLWLENFKQQKTGVILEMPDFTILPTRFTLVLLFLIVLFSFYLSCLCCIRFLELQYQITTDLGVYNNRNLFSDSCGSPTSRRLRYHTLQEI